MTLDLNHDFYILLHTQLIVFATVDSQCLEYLGYITLATSKGGGHLHTIKDGAYYYNRDQHLLFAVWTSFRGLLKGC